MLKRGETLLLVLSVGLLGLYFRDRNKTTVHDIQTAATVAKLSEPTAALAKTGTFQVRLPSQEGLGDIALGKELFETPKMAGANQYPAATPIAIKWDKSCLKKNPAKKFTELNELIKRHSGVNGEAQFPRDAHIEQISQLWSRNGTYYQLGARWDMTDPPTYRLEYFSSASPTLTGDITVMPIPGIEPGAIVDTESALQIINTILSAAKAEGAKEGARMVTLSVAAAAPDFTHRRLRFMNATPVEYTEPKVYCDRAASGKEAVCFCKARPEGEE